MLAGWSLLIPFTLFLYLLAFLRPAVSWHRQPLPVKLWQIMRASHPTADYHLFDPFDPNQFDSP